MYITTVRTLLYLGRPFPVVGILNSVALRSRYSGAVEQGILIWPFHRMKLELGLSVVIHELEQLKYSQSKVFRPL